MTYFSTSLAPASVSRPNSNVPFILMSSFNTADDTDRVIQKYGKSGVVRAWGFVCSSGSSLAGFALGSMLILDLFTFPRHYHDPTSRRFATSRCAPRLDATENHNINILTFNQSKYPRVNRDTLLPVAKEADSDNAGFYPPGHGNVLDALK